MKSILLQSRKMRGGLGIILVFAVTFGLTGVAVAQNLVPNPSFENYSLCPNFSGQINLASPWIMPTSGSSDYYNSCASNSIVSVPLNQFGNQNARTGNAYAGFILRPSNPNYREYIEVPLTAPLVPNVTYNVSFYVSLSDQSRWAIDKLGAYLSNGSVGPISNALPLSVMPQALNPPGNYITDKTVWTLVSGNYIALGGEDHLVIGNFDNDTLTTPLTGLGGFYNGVYYYIDDVSVSKENGTSCCPPPSNMVSWWPGDGNANDIQDSNHGTLQNGATFAAGKVGLAFSLDGVSQYVEVPDGASLNFGTGDFSIDAWIKTNKSVGFMPIVDKRDPGSTDIPFGYTFYLNDGKLGFGISNDVLITSPREFIGTDTTANLANGNWHHVAVTVNRTPFPTNGKLFVDGILVGTFGTIPFVGKDPVTTGPLRIGSHNPIHAFPPENFFNGSIDEVEIFNRALNASDIQSIFNAGSAGKCKLCTPLLVDISTGTAGIGNLDPNWQLIAAPVGTPPNAYGVTKQFIWVTPPPGSNWISFTTGFAPLGPSGTYTYEIKFMLDLNVYHNPQLTLQFASDDVSNVYLNSIPLSTNQPVSLPFQAPYTTAPSPITTGFINGQNTLRFEVNNNLGGDSSTGLLVSGNVTADCKCVLPPSDMVAWWPLDETGGTIVADIWGNPNHNGGVIGPAINASGGIMGSAPFVPAMVDGFFYFIPSSTSGWVSVPPHTDFDFGTSGNFSIDAWVNKVGGNNANDFVPIVDKRDSSGQPEGYMFAVDGTNHLRFFLGGTGYQSTNTLTPQAWYHVAVTVDRSTPLGTVTLYINGNPEPTTNLQPGEDATSTLPLLIGGTHLGPSLQSTEYALDEIEIFNRTLNQTEIQAIYDAGSVGKCKPENHIQLEPLWNYISFSGTLDNATPEHVLDGLSIDRVLHYNAQTRIWENAATFGEFKPRTAYAIRVSTPQTIVNIDYRPDVPPSLQLYGGWNSIGLVTPGSFTDNAEAAFASIDNSYDRIVGPWVSASGGHYSHNGFNENVYGPTPAGSINTDSVEYVLNRHEGHWINMTSADLLS